MTSEVGHRNPVEILGEEFLARRRRGENPQIEQYLDSHPEYAKQINELFPAMVAMEDLKARKNQSSERPIRLRVDRLEHLGDYRIIREIGHGGMGIVYEAEQQSLHRRVAVKVFPQQAIGDTQQLKRFQREAETAGALHHTNIVPVFGVGQQDGLHYFVMQYLDGVSLDAIIAELADPDSGTGEGPRIQRVFRSCLADKQTVGNSKGDSDGSTWRESQSIVEQVRSESQTRSSRPTRTDPGREHWRSIADIGIQVADALQYAHRHGVMHRDIKPSNLLLDADWRVWVTDFGLAITPEQDRLSRSGDVVGTLRYMAPEQLHGRPDQRSDLYSLGLTLYELMTMRPAFDGESRGSLIRKVSKSSPPSPRSVFPAIPRDLETVILKAIARSPESRYRSARELAEDLRRFRDDRPIRARRIGPVERLCRWSRRNPALAGMGLALMFGAALSFGAVGWNWRQAVAEKRNAEAEGRRAESNLNLALGSLDRLLKRFESDWMSHPVPVEAGDAGIDNELRFVVSDQSASVLEEALYFYDQFAEQNVNSPKLQRAIAKAYRRAGDIHDRLGRYPEALQAYRRSAATLKRQIDSTETDTALIAETAAVLNREALVLHAMYRSREAREVLAGAKSLLSGQLVRADSSQQCSYELALTNSNLGLVLWRMHEGEESVKRHRVAIMLLESLAEENPLEAKFRLALARGYRNYYPIAAACKEGLYADEIRASAAGLLQQLVADFPEVPDYRCELAELLTLSAQDTGRERALREEQARRASRLADSLCREFRTIPRYQVALANALIAEAALIRTDDPQRSLELHQRGASLLRQLCDQFPAVMAYRTLVANAMTEQARSLAMLSRFEESICLLEEAVTEQSLYVEARPDSVFGRRAMAAQLGVLAETLELAGDSRRASYVKKSAGTYWKQRPSSEN